MSSIPFWDKTIGSQLANTSVIRLKHTCRNKVPLWSCSWWSLYANPLFQRLYHSHPMYMLHPLPPEELLLSHFSFSGCLWIRSKFGSEFWSLLVLFLVRVRIRILCYSTYIVLFWFICYTGLVLAATANTQTPLRHIWQTSTIWKQS